MRLPVLALKFICTALALSTLFGVVSLYSSVRTEKGFGYTMTQCMFKSYQVCGSGGRRHVQ